MDIENNIENNVENNTIFNSKTSKGLYKVDCFSKNNGDILPRDISKKSRKNYLFICDVCSHEFSESVYNIVYKNRWCYYCSTNKLCNNNECELCYKNSFASCKEE